MPRNLTLLLFSVALIGTNGMILSPVTEQEPHLLGRTPDGFGAMRALRSARLRA